MCLWELLFRSIRLTVELLSNDKGHITTCFLIVIQSVRVLSSLWDKGFFTKLKASVYLQTTNIGLRHVQSPFWVCIKIPMGGSIQ